MKRLLVISYHWPPRAGVTALRSLKFAEHLRRRDWDVVVATSRAPLQDPSYLDAFPRDKVLEIEGWEPHGWYTRLTRRSPEWNAQDCLEVPPAHPHWLDGPARWIRGNVFVPDARRAWIRPALRRLRRFLARHPVDALFTSGPPHTNTWIGCLLARETGLPWVADFQDPWTGLPYLKQLPLTGWAWRRHRRMERAALATAALRTCTSPTWARDWEERGAGAVHVLPWGFDPEDLPPLRPVKYRVCLGGTLGPERSSEAFWRGLARWAHGPTGERLEVRIAGNVAEQVLSRVRGILGERVRFLGQLPRKQWLEELATAWVHGILTNPGQPGRLPAKFFECAGTGAPLLIMGDGTSDAERLGRELGHFTAQTGEQVADALEAARAVDEGWREERRARARPYHCGRIAQALDGLLREVLTGPRAGVQAREIPPGNPNKVDT